MNKMWLSAVLTGALLALSGCDNLPFGLTTVKEIVTAPAQFEGKEVRVKGKVKDITKIPLVELKLYVLDDGSGEITVVASESLPAMNESVTVKGVVESVAIVGGESIGLRIKETKRF